MNPAAAPPVYRTAIATAWIAGLFLAGVGGTMLSQRFTAESNDPWKSPQLLELKEKLRAAPKDEAIKERIRELDLRFRQRYVRRLARVAAGGWLLLGGGAVLLASLTVAVETRRRAPLPRPDPGAGDRAARQVLWSRRGVALTGVAVLAGGGAVVLGVHTSELVAPTAGGIPEWVVAAPTAFPLAAAAPAVPPPAEFLANWPRFLGPTGNSVAATADAPLHWDGATGAGVVWKTQLPAPGFNSPIIWGERLFLSGGTREQRAVFCFDTATGKLRWRTVVEKVAGSPALAPEIPDQTGYAPSTMATDGRHAYALFPTGDLAALNFDGAIVWSKHLGVPKNLYGHATSLAVWQGRLLVQFDQGESGPANSRLLAFEGATGRIVWEKPRAMPSSWASPIVVQAAGRTQVVTLGMPDVVAYDWNDGRELWKAHLLEGEITPSPVYAGGLVLAISPSNALLALRPDGTGEVTETHVQWKAEENIPDVTSPVASGGLAFTVTGTGMLTGFDLKTGAKVWEQDLQGEFQATPAIAGHRLYLVGTKGTTIVAEVGREYRELARNALDDGFLASPAFAGGRIYLRGRQHLYCLGGDAKKSAAP